MVLIGCVLMLAPCVMALIMAGVFGQMLSTALLPRERQPVPPAGSNETLALVANLSGSGSPNPAHGIDDALLDVLLTNYYTGDLRTGRVTETPTSSEEALALAALYRADVVVWGSYNADEMTVQITAADPLVHAEEIGYAITLPRNAAQADNAIGRLIAGVMLVHHAATSDSYYYYNASATLYDLYWNAPHSAFHGPEVALYLALAQHRTGDLAAAELTLKDALASSPDMPDLYLLYGQTLSDMGLFTDALAALDRAFELEPGLSEGYVLRGHVLYMTDQPEQALDDLERALDLNPDDSTALLERASIYTETGRYEEAIADYNALSALGPDRVDYYLQRARLYAKMGENEQALDELRRGDDLIGSRSYYDEEQAFQISLLRAQLLTEMGRYEEALDEYAAMSSVSVDAQLGPGLVYWAMGDAQRADEAWDAAFLAGSPGRADALNTLAWELALRGYYEPALPYADEAVTLAPGNEHIIHTRGYIYLGLGEYAEALADLQQAEMIGLGNYYPDLYRDLGDAHFGLGSYQQAALAYQRYLDNAYLPADRAEVMRRLAEAIAAGDGQP
ncbi:MAG: hypothetical protein Kow00124_29490 [Anaerolineae bacterium]